MNNITHCQEHVIAAVEKISQSFFQTCVVEVLAEEPVTDAVPEAAVGVVVGHLELVPVNLGSLGVHLKLEKKSL